MGHEYRIDAALTAVQRQHIATLLDGRAHARRLQTGGTAWELRAAGNTGQLPDTQLAMDAGGFAVCQYAGRQPWHGLDALRAWLDGAGIAWQVHEVDD